MFRVNTVLHFQKQHSCSLFMCHLIVCSIIFVGISISHQYLYLTHSHLHTKYQLILLCFVLWEGVTCMLQHYSMSVCTCIQYWSHSASVHTLCALVLVASNLRCFKSHFCNSDIQLFTVLAQRQHRTHGIPSTGVHALRITMKPLQLSIATGVPCRPLSGCTFCIEMSSYRHPTS